MKTVTEEEFRAGYRKAQLIDVREPNEFESGHILGARNIPMSQMKMRIERNSSRSSLFIYIAKVECAAAVQPNSYTKKVIKNLPILQGGFKRWTGKVKAK